MAPQVWKQGKTIGRRQMQVEEQHVGSDGGWSRGQPGKQICAGSKLVGHHQVGILGQQHREALRQHLMIIENKQPARRGQCSARSGHIYWFGLI